MRTPGGSASARTAWCACAVALAALALPPRAAAQKVLWVDGWYGAPAMYSANGDGTGVSSVPLPAGSLPDGLTYSWRIGTVIGSSAWSGATISRSDLSLFGPVLTLGGLSCVRGVAVDEATGRIYWTSSNLDSLGRIERVNSTGNVHVVVTNLGAGANPRGLAIAPGGRMFWADFDAGRIEAANLDGSLPLTFPSNLSGQGPWGVAVDTVGQRVYWSDYVGGAIQSANYDGTGVSNVYSGLSNPTYLAIDPVARKLYWVEAGSPRRWRRGPLLGVTPDNVSVPLSGYGGIAVIPASLLDAQPPAGPTDFALGEVTPNPAPPGAQISFALPRPARVRLALADVQGRAIATLAQGDWPAGRSSVPLAPAGRPLAPGLYFARLEAGGRTFTRRIVAIR